MQMDITSRANVQAVWLRVSGGAITLCIIGVVAQYLSCGVIDGGGGRGPGFSGEASLFASNINHPGTPGSASPRSYITFFFSLLRLSTNSFHLIPSSFPRWLSAHFFIFFCDVGGLPIIFASYDQRQSRVERIDEKGWMLVAQQFQHSRNRKYITFQTWLVGLLSSIAALCLEETGIGPGSPDSLEEHGRSMSIGSPGGL